MSNLKESIKQILGEEKLTALKVLLKFSEEKKFKDAKLKDGTVIRYEGETPAAGMEMYVITADGQTPAPDGNHEMEDGTVIVVEGGKITEVLPTAEKNEEPMNDMKTLQESVSVLMEQVKEIEKIKADFVVMSEFMNSVKTQMENQEKFSKEVFTALEKLSGLPSEEPANPPKDKFGKVKSLKEDIKGWREEIKKLKK
jgi:hypothetical protein